MRRASPEQVYASLINYHANNIHVNIWKANNFLSNEGHKGQHLILILATETPKKVKIHNKYTNTKEFILEGHLDIGYSVMAFVANKGQRLCTQFSKLRNSPNL